MNINYYVLFLFSFFILIINSVNVLAADKVNFKVFSKTDIPGFDYRSPKNDPSLKNIGKRGCMQVCAADLNCRAFTYNTKVKWCWLKNGFRKVVQYKHALSGIKQNTQKLSSINGANFKVQKHVDLPGFDYRSSSNDPSLVNIGASACLRACEADSACKAFTYNIKAKWCFLKNNYKRVKQFRAAISGIKVGSRETFIYKKSETQIQEKQQPIKKTKVRKTALKWSATVKDIRKAAIPYGGNCNRETEQIKRRFKVTNVTTESVSVKAGELIKLEWETSQPEGNLPVYLMISFNQPVRFEGKGFYPLMPKAQAAFGIEWNEKLARAVIPLYGSSARDKGEVLVKPLLEGSLELEWALVGYVRKCQQEITHYLGSETFQIDTPTKFEVVLNEPASLIKPEKIYLSPNGKTHVEVFKNRFRLIDSKTEAIILESAGTKPNYSPTGRFLTIQEGRIYDTVDGAELYSRGILKPWDDIGWQNEDSYLVTGLVGWGLHSIHFSLHNKMSYDGNGTCHACRGLLSGYSDIDIESNTVYVGSGEFGGIKVYDLFKKKEIYPTPSNENILADDFIRSTLAVADYAPPSHEQFIKQTKFTTILQGYGEEGVDPISYLIKKSLFIPQDISNSKTDIIASSYSVKNQKVALRLVSWKRSAQRGLQINTETFFDRLSEIGLHRLKPNKTHFYRETNHAEQIGEYFTSFTSEEINKIISKIYKTIPQAKGSFDRKKTSTSCWPGDENKIIRRFHKAVKYKTETKTIWLTYDECVAGSGGFHYPTLVLFDNRLKNGFKKLDPREEGNDIGNGCASIHHCGFELLLNKGRFLMFWSKVSGGVAIYDLEKHKFIVKKYGLPNAKLLKSFFFAKDANHFVQVNTDNSFYVYGLNDGQLVLEGRVADEEAIVWALTGQYDATPEGVHFVSLKFPGRAGQYSFQQFEKKLHVKGLVQKIFSGQKLPSFHFQKPPTLQAKIDLTNNNHISIETKTSFDSKVVKLHVYQDGILTNEITPTENPKKDYQIERLAGARWISVVAVDDQGLASLPIGRDIGEDKSKKSKLHYLTIGIDDYDQASDLKFAVADANNIAKTLKQLAGKSYELGKKSTLLNQDASKTAILDEARKVVEQAQKGDTIVFSFAGHGVRDKQGRFYLATSSIDPKNISETGFLWEELLTILKQAKGRIIVLLDSCHSGAAGTDDSIYATNDQLVSNILAKIPSGLLIFSASKGREESEEDGVRGGIFTNAIVDVISEKRRQFDTNQNGAIEISELYHGVKSLVVKNAVGSQTPWLARNQMVGDFALF